MSEREKQLELGFKDNQFGAFVIGLFLILLAPVYGVFAAGANPLGNSFVPVSLRPGDLLIAGILVLIYGRLSLLIEVIYFGNKGVLARMDSATQRELARNGTPAAPPLPQPPAGTKTPAARRG